MVNSAEDLLRSSENVYRYFRDLDTVLRRMEDGPEKAGILAKNSKMVANSLEMVQFFTELVKVQGRKA